jgi:hypothetical protein
MDYAILRDMDEAFCAASAEEIANVRAQQQEEAQSQAGANNTRARMAAARARSGR